MEMRFRVVMHEGTQLKEVSGELKNYPEIPLSSLVDAIQMAVLEAGFSFNAEVLDLEFYEKEVNTP